MEITWVGGSCFRFRGREAAVVTDPQTSGLTKTGSFPKADLVASSVSDKGSESVNLVQANHKDRGIFVASGPGEYDVCGVFLRGLVGSTVADAVERPIVYAMDIDRVTVAYIVKCTAEFDSALLDELGTVQVLIVNADKNTDGGVRNQSDEPAETVMETNKIVMRKEMPHEAHCENPKKIKA